MLVASVPVARTGFNLCHLKSREMRNKIKQNDEYETETRVNSNEYKTIFRYMLADRRSDFVPGGGI